jgi:UDP-GlcNAc:undecaprenyl-phosphate GlcNAc-1-phosphate transferase
MISTGMFLGMFGLTIVLSLGFTGLVRRYALKNKLTPELRDRDSHKTPTPRIGGMAIFAAFFIISIIYFLLINRHAVIGGGQWFGLDKRIVSIWLATLIIVSSMLFDDLRGLTAWKKFGFQALAALIVIAGGIGVGTLSNPFGHAINLDSVIITLNFLGRAHHIWLWSDLLAFFWLIGMMNVINFIDGIDGLAAGVSGIAAFIIFLLSLAVSQSAVAMISIILCGAAVGFLYWNFYPAKIFMGDSGSMFLGFMLGILPLISGGKLATAFLVLGFAIVDGLIVAGARIIRGKNPFTTPDKTHLHHRFLAAGFSVPATVLSLYFIAALFGWVALRSTTLNKIIASSFLIVIIAGLILILNQIKKRRKNV